MGRIQNWRWLSREDFPNPPDEEWFDRLLDAVNRHNEDVTTLLQGGISTANENASVVKLTDVLHNTARLVSAAGVKGNPVAVTIDWSQTAHTGIFWEMKDENLVEVTVLFNGAPTDYQEVHYRIRGD